MSLAYDYQRAIDAAQTLCELTESLQERDRELLIAENRLKLLRRDLEDTMRYVLIPRRDCLNPDAADETKATKGGAA